ncbi:MAG: DUF1080 domain-containing protein, partial [Caulobacterales bacterium]|nr:DUF1080 domain-containing protein [Caulobacterales bacterium]
EDGVIVGEAADDTPNTFLSSEERFADFVLELEINVDPTLNSGVIFRGDSREDYREGRVYGYQAEVDPSSRSWSGGIYEEQRRGWLTPPTRNAPCQEAFTPGEWNAYRIEAVGGAARVWINDTPCSDLIDADGAAEGFIGLQVHSTSPTMGQAGDKARFRNIRIMTDPGEADLRPVEPEIHQVNLVPNTLSAREERDGWRLLWDGETTEGWRGARLEGFPEIGWVIEEGELIVLSSGGGEARNGGDIVTTEDFDDFELSLEFKLTEGANSGIKYFVDPDLLQGPGSAIGLEFQILDDKVHPDAKMGVAGNRTVGSLYDLITAGNMTEPERDTKRVKPIGEWNHARIVVVGAHVEHWLNDVKVLEFERGTPMYRALVAYSKYAQWDNFGEWETGPVLLQDHGDRVAFRSIKIRELGAGE